MYKYFPELWISVKNAGLDPEHTVKPWMWLPKHPERCKGSSESCSKQIIITLKAMLITSIVGDGEERTCLDLREDSNQGEIMTDGNQWSSREGQES